MNRQEQIEQIKRRLPDDPTDDLIGELFDSWLEIALAKSNRKEDSVPSALLSIVRETVIEAYNRRGDEGSNGGGAGGQNYSYTDLEDMLLKRILQANLRVMRL